MFSKLGMDIEHIEAMHAAFRRVSDILQLECYQGELLTELIVLKIVELAKAGERDPEVLCNHVLAKLQRSQASLAPPDSPLP